MKCISIRQPWAGAVALGWKPVENRSQMFSHRGQVLIHTGLQLAEDFTGAERTILDTAGQAVPLLGRLGQPVAWQLGAIIAVGDLYAAHRGCNGSCAPGWAQPGQVHHKLRDVRPLRRAIPCPGRLGVFTPDQDVLDAVKDAWPR